VALVDRDPPSPAELAKKIKGSIYRRMVENHVLRKPAQEWLADHINRAMGLPDGTPVDWSLPSNGILFDVYALSPMLKWEQSITFHATAMIEDNIADRIAENRRLFPNLHPRLAGWMVANDIEQNKINFDDWVVAAIDATSWQCRREIAMAFGAEPEMTVSA
jgi:hypothetical protein